MGPSVLGHLYPAQKERSGGGAIRLFNDREAHAGLVAVFFRERLSEAERAELTRLLKRLLEGLDQPGC